MTQEIPLNIAVEDALSESVIYKLLNYCGRNYYVGNIYSRGGYGYLKSNVTAFNHAARVNPYLLLTDLDQTECAPILIREWLPHPTNRNLIFRVAVKEVESWLIADRENLSRFLGVTRNRFPLLPDDISNPKGLIINTTRRSRKRKLLQDIVPPAGSTRKQGPNYNGRLIEFVESYWEPDTARTRSNSLDRAIIALEQFTPVWPE
jgi:hypothetical protein